MTTIVGISCWYHDSAVAVVRDGVVVCAAQEERFSRRKGDADFPEQALRFCMGAAGVSGLADIDHIVFYEKPFIKFERLIETHLKAVPWGLPQFCRAMPSWIKQKLMARHALEKDIRRVFADRKTPLPPLLFNDHHGSHAAMAFFPSPFEEAAILCLDGVGEWATGTAWAGRGNQLQPLWEINFPHSLGLLYSAFTSFCGFAVNDGEYKLMGLAPFGEPVYAELIERELITIRPDGSFRMNMRYFSYPHGLRMTNRKFALLFGGPALPLGAVPGRREMDLAASIQAVTEKILLRVASDLQQRTGMRSLCLGGGVALNCVATAALRRAGVFDDIWVNPAPGDAGSAIGCALSCWHEYLGRPRVDTAYCDSLRERSMTSLSAAQNEPPTSACCTQRSGVAASVENGNEDSILNHACLGPEWSDDDIKSELARFGARFDVLWQDAMLQTTAELLAQGKVVGWFQGRMEFGPRALGARSILADPRDPDMIQRLNLKIKKRESFRPFAASVLAEEVQDWFDVGTAAVGSPFMNTIACVAQSKQVRGGVSGVERAEVWMADGDSATAFADAHSAQNDVVGKGCVRSGQGDGSGRHPEWSETSLNHPARSEAESQNYSDVHADVAPSHPARQKVTSCCVRAANRSMQDPQSASLHNLDSIHNSRSVIPAVTHVDMSSRIHTVTAEQNLRFYQLIRHFGEITGVPLLVNTSFNVRGEPIVCTPEDAWRCFMATDMDVLVMGSCLLFKEKQRSS
jgi:carbamoyltransferase